MAFDLLTYLVIMAVSAGISYLLRPKPESPDAAGLEDWNVPTCEQGTPYSVIFGRPPRFKSTMILWYGDYAVRDIEVSGGLFGGSPTIGYKYYLGVHFGLCHGNVDALKQLWVDGRCLWPTKDDTDAFEADGTLEFTMSEYKLWGGSKKGGGLIFHTDVLLGDSSQGVSTYLRQFQDGDDTPRYRGITAVLFKRAYWGVQPQLPIVEFVAKRTNIRHDETAVWYSAKAVVDSNDNYNVVHVMYECLTSMIFGRGISVDNIDDANWRVAADTVYSEGFGISYRYIPGQSSIAEFISKLEQIIDGFVYWDHSDSQYKIKLVRDDYDPDALTTYDEDDFSIDTFSRITYFQAPSETAVMYTDVKSVKKTPAKDDDKALMEIQGLSPVSQTFEFPMLTDRTMALKVASREQDQVSRMPASAVLRCKRTMYAETRAGVFKITHPRLTAAGINSMTVRVVSKNLGTLTNGYILMNVVEEIFEETLLTIGVGDEGIVDFPDQDVGVDPMDNSITFDFDEIEVSIINEAVV